jgi:hypothetical protein
LVSKWQVSSCSGGLATSCEEGGRHSQVDARSNTVLVARSNIEMLFFSNNLRFKKLTKDHVSDVFNEQNCKITVLN